mgnify:CR=1 FL=1
MCIRDSRYPLRKGEQSGWGYVELVDKEDGNPTVYTVKSLTAKDGDPYWPDFKNNAYDRGEYNVTSDVIHAVVPSNQLLRPYDNVPRVARAQEISANRLIYGNYLQNYNADDPQLLLQVHSQDLNQLNISHAAPSVKTMRTYQIGVVFCDKYGRETPVLASSQDGTGINLKKEFSNQQNQFRVKVHNNKPTWADSFKFFVKETSH